MHLSPLDDKTKRRLILAVAERGKASGLEAAAKILAEMANHKGRVVGTNSIRDLSALLIEKATEIRSQADAEIAAMEAETK